MPPILRARCTDAGELGQSAESAHCVLPFYIEGIKPASYPVINTCLHLNCNLPRLQLKRIIEMWADLNGSTIEWNRRTYD